MHRSVKTILYFLLDEENKWSFSFAYYILHKIHEHPVQFLYNNQPKYPYLEAKFKLNFPKLILNNLKTLLPRNCKYLRGNKAEQAPPYISKGRTLQGQYASCYTRGANWLISVL